MGTPVAYFLPGPQRIPWERPGPHNPPDKLQRWASTLRPPADMGENYTTVGGRVHGWMEMVEPRVWQTHYYSSIIHHETEEENTGREEAEPRQERTQEESLEARIRRLLEKETK